MSRAGRTEARVRVVEDGHTHRRSDALATEEPLEIRVEIDGRSLPISVTMRTPGADFDLVAGFLLTEGIVDTAADLPRLGYCLDAGGGAGQRFNVVTATLRPGLAVDLTRIERHFYTSSACGVCGKASLEQLELRGLRPAAAGPAVAAELIFGLPDSLRAAQGLFHATGGLHAAGLFAPDGRLIAAREDVGRHNAVDKLVGWALFDRRLPLAGHIVVVSGRASFEIMQKCLAAGVPVVCAVSAPSSLAVDVARAFGMTLVGFMRGRRFNVYAGFERIVAAG